MLVSLSRNRFSPAGVWLLLCKIIPITLVTCRNYWDNQIQSDVCVGNLWFLKVTSSTDKINPRFPRDAPAIVKKYLLCYTWRTRTSLFPWHLWRSRKQRQSRETRYQHVGRFWRGHCFGSNVMMIWSSRHYAGLKLDPLPPRHFNQ